MEQSTEKAKKFVLIRYVKRENTWPYIYAVDANGIDAKINDTVHVSSGLAKGTHSYTEAVVVGFLTTTFALAQGVDYHAPYPEDDKGNFALLESQPYGEETKYFNGRQYDSNGYTGDAKSVATIRTCAEKLVGDAAIKLLDDLAILDFQRQGFVANNHALGAKYAEQQKKQDATIAMIADAYGVQAAEAFKKTNPIIVDDKTVNSFAAGLADFDAKIAALKAKIDEAFC